MWMENDGDVVLELRNCVIGKMKRRIVSDWYLHHVMLLAQEL